MNVRTIEVLTQAILNGNVTLVGQGVTSAGQLREISRGVLGELRAVQIEAGHQALLLLCENAIVRILLSDNPSQKAIPGLKALLGSHVNMPTEDYCPQDVTQWKTDASGRRAVQILDVNGKPLG